MKLTFADLKFLHSTFSINNVELPSDVLPHTKNALLVRFLPVDHDGELPSHHNLLDPVPHLSSLDRDPIKTILTVATPSVIRLLSNRGRRPSNDRSKDDADDVSDFVQEGDAEDRFDAFEGLDVGGRSGSDGRFPGFEEEGFDIDRSVNICTVWIGEFGGKGFGRGGEIPPYFFGFSLV